MGGFIRWYKPLHSIRVVPDTVIDSGFVLAKECHPTSIKESDIQFYIVKGHPFHILWDREGKIGYSIYYRVFVSEDFKNNPKMWAHEILHVILKYPGHPAKYFDRCEL